MKAVAAVDNLLGRIDSLAVRQGVSGAKPRASPHVHRPCVVPPRDGVPVAAS